MVVCNQCTFKTKSEILIMLSQYFETVDLLEVINFTHGNNKNQGICRTILFKWWAVCVKAYIQFKESKGKSVFAHLQDH
jgi:hypothetical protein